MLCLPFGVVVNKAMAEDQSIQAYCTDNEITVLMELPFSRRDRRGVFQGDPAGAGRRRVAGAVCIPL